MKLSSSCGVLVFWGKFQMHAPKSRNCFNISKCRTKNPEVIE